MGKCKLKDEWLKRKDPNGYIVESWAGKHELFCIICESKINVDHGFSRVEQHAENKCHIKNYKDKLTSLQLRLGTSGPNASANVSQLRSDVLPTSSSLLNLYSDKEKALKAKLMWAIKCVISNFPFHSNSDIKDLFGAMFGFANIPDAFSLSATKMMYLITEALGPYFHQNMLKDVADCAYSIYFDETTNECGMKELQIAVRYWSNTESKIVQKHVQTFLFIFKTQNMFKTQKFYLAAYTYLKGQLKIEGNILADLRCLDKDKFRSCSSESQIIALGKALPFNVDICRLLDEWRILKFEEIGRIDDRSIDQYWSDIISIKSSTNEIKFPFVSQVVKAMLALSHGSAAVERGFSTSDNVLTSDKTAMTEKGLNAHLNVLSGMKNS